MDVNGQLLDVRGITRIGDDGHVMVRLLLTSSALKSQICTRLRTMNVPQPLQEILIHFELVNRAAPHRNRRSSKSNYEQLAATVCVLPQVPDETYVREGHSCWYHRRTRRASLSDGLRDRLGRTSSNGPVLCRPVAMPNIEDQTL